MKTRTETAAAIRALDLTTEAREFFRLLVLANFSGLAEVRTKAIRRACDLGNTLPVEEMYSAMNTADSLGLAWRPGTVL